MNLEVVFCLAMLAAITASFLLKISDAVMVRRISYSFLAFAGLFVLWVGIAIIGEPKVAKVSEHIAIQETVDGKKITIIETNDHKKEVIDVVLPENTIVVRTEYRDSIFGLKWLKKPTYSFSKAGK